jgi:hypothetical protein
MFYAFNLFLTALTLSAIGYLFINDNSYEINFLGMSDLRSELILSIFLCLAVINVVLVYGKLRESRLLNFIAVMVFGNFLWLPAHIFALESGMRDIVRTKLFVIRRIWSEVEKINYCRDYFAIRDIKIKSDEVLRELALSSDSLVMLQKNCELYITKLEKEAFYKIPVFGELSWLWNDKILPFLGDHPVISALAGSCTLALILFVVNASFENTLNSFRLLEHHNYHGDLLRELTKAHNFTNESSQIALRNILNIAFQIRGFINDSVPFTEEDMALLRECLEKVKPGYVAATRAVTATLRRTSIGQIEPPSE